MFKPNLDCLIHTVSGRTDVYGQAIPGPTVRERCSVVKIVVASSKSSVRADTSASRGNAHELQSDAVLLLRPASSARLNDMIEVLGYKLRVFSRHPRHDVRGRLDHIEVGCSFWSEK